MIPEQVKIYLRTLRAWHLSRGLDSRGPFEQTSEEREATRSISVVIPVHDAPKVTHRCLQSLMSFGGEAEIVIVDDGSTLDTTRAVLDESTSINGWTLLKNRRPRGHSRASEIGVAASTRPYVCLLNSDTVITPHSWAGIVRAFESNREIGIAGPVTSYTAGPQKLLRACHCRHYWSDEQIWCFAQRHVTKHRQSPLIDVPFVGGFAFFVRRSVWNTLNGFDASLPDYGNESEFCRRAVRSGARIVYSNAGYIHHFGSESYGRTIGSDEIRRRCMNGKAFLEQRYGASA
jgi:GT2 family glycosyltransferase